MQILTVSCPFAQFETDPNAFGANAVPNPPAVRCDSAASLVSLAGSEASATDTDTALEAAAAACAARCATHSSSAWRWWRPRWRWRCRAPAAAAGSPPRRRLPVGGSNCGSLGVRPLGWPELVMCGAAAAGTCAHCGLVGRQQRCLDV